MTEITVAIATWNRAKLLDRTLIEMHRLRIPPGVEWKLLVVNNNCTDQTDTVISNHKKYGSSGIPGGSILINLFGSTILPRRQLAAAA